MSTNTNLLTLFNKSVNHQFGNGVVKHKGVVNTNDIIKNWFRNRDTVELPGFWEQLYNPDFKPL
jgi:hypothetical protein